MFATCCSILSQMHLKCFMKLNRVPEASVNLHNGGLAAAQRVVCGKHMNSIINLECAQELLPTNCDYLPRAGTTKRYSNFFPPK